MRYLITGIGGFVGAHLTEKLLSDGHQVMGIDTQKAAISSGVDFHQLSLMDRPALKELVMSYLPQRIVHLASASSVAFSWENPVECFVNNTNIFLNLIETVRECRVPCRILSVGSSEEYGPVGPGDIPLAESRPSNPMNPYAVARVAQEYLSKVYAKGYGLDIVCTRSFNHIGPGQTDRFVVSSFVRQGVEVALGKRTRIRCGSLDIIRDFTDVRDVVRAYEVILEKGASGEIYNVCSGKGVSLRDLLFSICRELGIPAVFDQDAKLIRPIDNPVIVGSNAKLSAIGYEPVYALERSVSDLIVWWKKCLE